MFPLYSQLLWAAKWFPGFWDMAGTGPPGYFQPLTRSLRGVPPSNPQDK